MGRETDATAWLRRLVDATRERRGWQPWAMALGLLGLSLALRIGLHDWLDAAPFLVYFPVIAATALFCGGRQGLLVLALAALCARLLWQRSGLPAVGAGVIGLLGFLATGGFVLALTTALAEAIRRLEAATRAQAGLFRELQHRVANNMQTIAGMLSLARRELRDPDALRVLEQASERIASMAALHRRLSDRAAYAGGLEPILRDVLAEVFRDLAVELRLDIRRDGLSFDQMTAIVLLVNEAAMNAAKHVFRTARGTLFEVALTPLPSGRLLLSVRDDGPGLAPQPAGPPTQRLGLTIMRAFARQLGGSLDLADGPGTILRVEFAPA